MRLKHFTPRADWTTEVERAGLPFHTPDGVPYWIDHRAFAFTPTQIEKIRSATNELYRLYLLAAEHVVANDLFAELAIPDWVVPHVRRSWGERAPAVYGRFDLIFDGTGEPKLVEFNADTPTSVIESSAAQVSWLRRHRDELPAGAAQFNELERNLTAGWRALTPRVGRSTVYFAHMREWTEDQCTTDFMRACATGAGLATSSIAIEDVGWDGVTFRDLEGAPIDFIYKLYPWEMVWRDEFGPAFLAHPGVIEPLWKIILQSKGILAILWRLFPDHPNLLRTTDSRDDFGDTFVRKPRLSRLGGNVSVHEAGTVESSDGFYDDSGFVYQEFAALPLTDHGRALMGSWIANGVASGISIRESDGKITDNYSRFVPHYVTD